MILTLINNAGADERASAGIGTHPQARASCSFGRVAGRACLGLKMAGILHRINGVNIQNILRINLGGFGMRSA